MTKQCPSSMLHLLMFFLSLSLISLLFLPRSLIFIAHFKLKDHLKISQHSNQFSSVPQNVPASQRCTHCSMRPLTDPVHPGYFHTVQFDVSHHQFCIGIWNFSPRCSSRTHSCLLAYPSKGMCKTRLTCMNVQIFDLLKWHFHTVHGEISSFFPTVDLISLSVLLSLNRKPPLPPWTGMKDADSKNIAKWFERWQHLLEQRGNAASLPPLPFNSLTGDMEREKIDCPAHSQVNK